MANEQAIRRGDVQARISALTMSMFASPADYWKERATLAEAEAERLLNLLCDMAVGWKCHAGGETFTTYDAHVALEWESDGLNVEKFILTPNDKFSGAANE